MLWDAINLINEKQRRNDDIFKKVYYPTRKAFVLHLCKTLQKISVSSDKKLTVHIMKMADQLHDRFVSLLTNVM